MLGPLLGRLGFLVGVDVGWTDGAEVIGACDGALVCAHPPSSSRTNANAPVTRHEGPIVGARPLRPANS